MIHIVDMGGESRSFEVSYDEPLTPRQIIAAFYAIPPERVEAKLAERAFRIVSTGALKLELLDSPLIDGDTIAVYSHAIARHGVKGRFVLSRPKGIPGVKTIEMYYGSHTYCRTFT